MRKVFVLTRHGDRTPTLVYPVTHQWDHLGELTGEGMNQLHQVGANLRKHYVDTLSFLSASYVRHELHVRSTSSHRTLVSAQALLSGLYPHGTGPTRARAENHALPHGFSPIPVFSAELSSDLLMKSYKNCPLMKELRAEIYKTEEWKEKEQETKQLRDEIATILGVKEIKLKKISSAFHALNADRVHHGKQHISDQLFSQVIALKDWVLHRKYHSQEMGRIGAGILLNHIVTTMEHYTQKNHTSKLKMTYFSGHDSTFLALFAAMGFRNNFKIPGFAALLVIELHQDEADGSFWVRVKYNNDVLVPHWEHIALPDFKQEVANGLFSVEEFHKLCTKTESTCPAK